MNAGRVLVVGGTGYFGKRLVEDLLCNVDCELIVSSRTVVPASRFKTIVSNLHDRDSLARALDGVEVAICAAGPFQSLPTTLAELCLDRGIHYIDLADDRGFVQRVRNLTRGRGRASSAVCTGWSTAPALSGLLSGILSSGMTFVRSIQIHLAPGNRGARRTATVASLLHSVGRSFEIRRDGRWLRVTGWSEPRDFVFPSPVGRRRGYLVDVPDHEIFPEMFGAAAVAFRAGSELRILNLFLSLLRLTGRNWSSWSAAFQRALTLLSWIGRDCGALGVEISGAVTRRACIIADDRAERIAVMPASVMTAELLTRAPHRGLVSYSNWISEDRLRLECARRYFRFVMEEV